MKPVMLLPLALAACGGGTRLASWPGSEPCYAAPGPQADPWGPYIRQASNRFSVPQGWIRAVIRQESGGHEYLHGRPTTSDAGAMGLMQLMPATYSELRDRYGLGNDPYDPRDNIMAGTGYISELYAKYGAPAFLVAYNAGPRRMDEYNAGRGTLPDETVAYLASVAPALAAEGPMTGPLAVYAAGGHARAPVQVYAAYAKPLGGCWRDPDAAYDPDDKCNRASPPAAAPVQVSQAVAPKHMPVYASAAALPGGCRRDPDAAYDSDAPCAPPSAPAPVEVAEARAPAAYVASAPQGACWHDPDAAYDPDAPCSPRPPAQPEAAAATGNRGDAIPPAKQTPPPSGVYLASDPYRARSYGTAPAPASAAYQVANTTPVAGSYRPTGYQPTGRYPDQTSTGARLAQSYQAPRATPATHSVQAPRYAAATPRQGHFSLIGSARAEPMRVSRLDARWSVQVGAFANADQARLATIGARHVAPRELASAQTVLGRTAPFGGQVMYRAKLTGITQPAASSACGRLAAQRWTCVTVPPGG